MMNIIIIHNSQHDKMIPGKKPKQHSRSKTWDTSNGSPRSPTPPGGFKKQASSYAPKKDRETFRSALVNIIM